MEYNKRDRREKNAREEQISKFSHVGKTNSFLRNCFLPLFRGSHGLHRISVILVQKIKKITFEKCSSWSIEFDVLRIDQTVYITIKSSIGENLICYDSTKHLKRNTAVKINT